jgi:ferric-dicitrate binding protein FerR (iron transport regulator)
VIFPRERLEVLISRYFDDCLDRDEEQELGELLQESSEARSVMASYLRLEGARLGRKGLREWTADRRSDSPAQVSPSLMTRFRTTRFLSWALGLAAGFLVVLSWVFLLHKGHHDPRSSPRDPEPGILAVSPVQANAEETRTKLGKDSALSSGSGLESAESRSAQEGQAVDRDDPRSSQPPAEGSRRVTKREEARTARPVAKGPAAAPAPLPQTEAFAAVVERMEGRVFLVSSAGRRLVRPGEGLHTGDGLDTEGPKSQAVMAYPDGTSLELEPETQIRNVIDRDAAKGKQLLLNRGALLARVRKQPVEQPMCLMTPHGEVRALGTTLKMTVDAATSRVEVLEGRVKLTRSSDDRAIELTTGHFAIAGSGGDLVARQSPGLAESFQDGLFPTAQYAGTRDTELSEKEPARNFGTAKMLEIDSNDARSKRKTRWSLLRWDLSTIPGGSRVLAATVTLNVIDPSPGQVCMAYESERSWSETEATWKVGWAGIPWKIKSGPVASDGSIPCLGQFAPSTKGETAFALNEFGIATVQSWINSPQTNFGILLMASGTGDGIRVISREGGVPATRPKLTVLYAPRK